MGVVVLLCLMVFRNADLGIHTGQSTKMCIRDRAHVAEDYPLYYDAMNEKGVAMAGLNFVGNAVYAAIKPDVENIAQFE